MTRNLRLAGLCVILALSTLSTFAQSRPMVGTVYDIDLGPGRLQIELDDASRTRMTIETDSVSTVYHGFGTMIGGKPEIFTGSAGLANVRLDDRISVRGPALREGVYRADAITLVGRDVPASQVGVGTTRDPSRSGTATTDDRATGTTTAADTVEGTIRQINVDEGRLVIQTTDRRMLTVRTFRNTPVYYRGEAYRVPNLELGDRVRIERDPAGTATDELLARRIDVLASVQESGGATAGTGGTVTMLVGRVTRTEPGLDYVYVDAGRGTTTRVDMRAAEDANGEMMRARDLRVGDQVEISGSYNRVGDMFLASTVRFGSDIGVTDERLEPREDLMRYAVVTITGTVTETLEDGATIGFRDRDTNAVLRIWVTEDFIVRTKGTTYANAESLKVNDTAVIKAYRDESGNLIAQNIRLRNR
ncbi:MAG TPA: hypothetical protein VEK79_09610 [Thermoanaerobaculia bacterium]|nr:hypothetical protein [Thermoanaerobaculia bacterium]